MTTTALDAARALPRSSFRMLVLGTLLCLSRAMALAAPAVELLRDAWGTPHVSTTTETDGFFGLGYAAAEDRLLQIELIRRKAAGRLAEVFGPDWVAADREARIAGHTAYAPRAFAPLPERWQNALRAYAAGRIDARGLGIPGCPGLLIGWNRRVAWGASALGMDSHVVFHDRLTPDGKGCLFAEDVNAQPSGTIGSDQAGERPLSPAGGEGVRRTGEGTRLPLKPVPFDRRLERIEVRGGQPVIQEVLTSRHGTVFNALVRSPRAGEANLLCQNEDLASIVDAPVLHA